MWINRVFRLKAVSNIKRLPGPNPVASTIKGERLAILALLDGCLKHFLSTIADLNYVRLPSRSLLQPSEKKYQLVVFSFCENNDHRSTMRLKENITKSRKNITSRFTKWDLTMFRRDVHKIINEFYTEFI